MLVRLPEYDGRNCDYTGQPMREAVGAFARGATGRVCLVLAFDVAEAPNKSNLVSLEEVATWAESVPNGYLDY